MFLLNCVILSSILCFGFTRKEEIWMLQIPISAKALRVLTPVVLDIIRSFVLMAKAVTEERHRMGGKTFRILCLILLSADTPAEMAIRA